MKARSVVFALALCFIGAALSFAENPNMGTWKLDEAKSHIPAGFMKNSTVVYAADGDNVKVTTDGTDRDGKPMHTEWTGKFDGKDYPLSGDPTADSRSYRKMNDGCCFWPTRRTARLRRAAALTCRRTERPAP